MGWSLIDFNKYRYSLPKKKCRFLVDKNIPIEIPQVLQRRGYKVFHVDDLDVGNCDDEFLYHYAYKNNLVIISQDRDFLNHQRFSFQCNPIVIIFQVDAYYYEILDVILNSIAPYKDIYEKSKIYITSDGTITIYSISEEGKLDQFKYKSAGYKKVYIWK